MATGQSGIQIKKSLIDCKTICIHTLTDTSPTNVGTAVIKYKKQKHKKAKQLLLFCFMTLVKRD
jgi:hypothetical protein